MSQNRPQSGKIAKMLGRLDRPGRLRESTIWPALVFAISAATPVGVCFFVLSRAGYTAKNLALVGLFGYAFLTIAIIIGAEIAKSTRFEDVSERLDQFPGPVDIRTSKWKRMALFVIVATPLFTLGGMFVWFVARVGSAIALLSSGLVVLISGTVLVFLFRYFANPPPLLTLDSEGFSVHHRLGETRKRWNDVSDFDVHLGMVEFSDTSPPTNRWDKLARVGSGRTRLPDVSLTAQLLSRLMTAWRELALATTHERQDTHGRIH
jgi:hypothetical protein